MNPQQALVVSTDSLARQLQSNSGWASATGAARATAMPTAPISILAFAGTHPRKRRIVKKRLGTVEESCVVIIGPRHLFLFDQSSRPRASLHLRKSGKNSRCPSAWDWRQ